MYDPAMKELLENNAPMPGLNDKQRAELMVVASLSTFAIKLAGANAADPNRASELTDKIVSVFRKEHETIGNIALALACALSELLTQSLERDGVEVTILPKPGGEG